MKNLFKSLMLVAVAAMAFTACTETNEEVNAVSKGTTINFNVSFADETRVSLTDDNEDGVYQAAFEAGDKIVFAAYDLNGNMLTYTDEIILTEEQAADENLTLTANFKSEVGVGSEIKAYVNYYYDSWAGGMVSYLFYYYQVAMVDSVENLNASAELVWNGEEYANIIFKHDNSFGKMTLKADGDVKFREVSINLYDGEGNYKYTTVVDEAQKVNNVFFFALSGEALNVSTLNVEAYDVNGNLYQFAKEFDPGKFHFKKGRVSKFTIDKWYVSLDMPQVKATPSVDGSEVVFSWEPVANAAGYEVSVGYNEPTFTQETSCKVSLAGYNPFETVYISVKAKAGKDTMFMDSQMANASYTVPINKNAYGENGYTFVYTQVEERGTNKYKFYNDNEKEYMYVYFEDDITALEPGSYVYSLNDGVIGYTGDSAYRHPLYDNGSYLEFWFQGDFMMFVDVADDKTYTITTFCKRYINDGDHLYKSTWTGKFGGGSEEPEPELKDPETVELLYASAAPAPSNMIGGTGYNVTFRDGEGKEYFWQVQTQGKNYLEVGEWNGNYNYAEVGYVNYVEWPGVSSPWPYIMNVAVDGKLYDINLQVTDYVGWGGTGLTHTAHFKGNIEGMTLPGEEPQEPEPEPEVVKFTSVKVEAADSNLNYHNLTFTNGTYTAIIKLCTRGTTEYVAGLYDQNGSYSDASSLCIGGYTSDNTWNGAECWPVTMEVIDNGNGTATFNLAYAEYPSAVQHKGTFTGVLPGLTLVERKVEEPETGDAIKLEVASIYLTGNSYGDWHIKDANGNDILALCNPELGNMSTLPTIELSTSKSGDFDMGYCNFCYDGNNYKFSDAGITMTMSITANGGRNATIKASLVCKGQTYTIDWTGSY